MLIYEPDRAPRPDGRDSSRDTHDQVRKLQRQQAAIARFGSFALREWDMAKILDEAVRVCADGLDVPFAKVCRYRPEEHDLLIVAGCGWREGVIGSVVSSADASSPQGRAFCTGEPAICNDVQADPRFDLPPFYAAHGIVSIIDVVIKGSEDQPYGILEIDNNERCQFDQYDINFLTGFANVLAEAVATAARAVILQQALDRLKATVAEKDALLREKDITDARLRQAHKMEAIGQLTGGVAHDLNNILTVIVGAVEALAEEIADRPQLAVHVTMIADAAERCTDLTRRLLAVARKQPLKPQEVDVNALIGEAANLLRPTLGGNIEIVLNLDRDAAHALIDAGQLTNALLNLAINARDAMPNGGRLTIETRNVVLDEHDIIVSGEVIPGNYVLIAVSDSGFGIAADHLNKVFEPFFTTKPIGKGTGLGLSMVYGFVKQSLGHITIQSETGMGTTIRIYLPRAGGIRRPADAVTAA